MNPNNQRPRQGDPFIVASLMGSYLNDRNPIQVLTGEITRMVSIVANLNKTREMAQKRIDQLQEQVNQVEANIQQINPKTAGNRFDRLR